MSAAVSDALGFEVASRAIPPALHAYVRSWYGYVEHTAGQLRRRELPEPKVVVIFEFGPPIRVFDSGSISRSSRYAGGFVAGLDDQFSLTEHDGFQAGIQLNLTPLGARTLFGIPASELSRRIISLDDVLPGHPRSFADQLASALTWEARFDLVHDVLVRAVRERGSIDSPAVWAAQRIEAAGGVIEIGSLCRELGYSHKHVLSLFRRDIGLSPKSYARLTRWSATLARLRAARGRPDPQVWSALAFDAGYADQSHLVREVKQFSGLTPTDLLRLLDGYPM